MGRLPNIDNGQLSVSATRRKEYEEHRAMVSQVEDLLMNEEYQAAIDVIAAAFRAARPEASMEDDDGDYTPGILTEDE